MTVEELNDQQIMSLLPATCPEMAVKLSGTANKNSLEYKRFFCRINRHLKTMDKCGMIHWNKVIDNAKLWEVI